MKRPLPSAKLQASHVKIYRNTKKNCFSVLHRRKVKGHAAIVILENVEFLVRENGRQRTIRTKKRYLHAFANGTLKHCCDHRRHRLPGQASGWIDPPYYVEKKKSGKRHGPYFNYCYQVKEDDIWKTKRIAIGGKTAEERTRKKAEVELAIALYWTPDEIISLILGDITIDHPIQITYNPYTAGYFYEVHSGKPIYTARVVIASPAGVFAYS